MTLEVFKMWNQMTVEGCLTFPVNWSWFRVLVLCSAATKDCRLKPGINLNYRKTFLEIYFPHLIHPEIILKEFNLTTYKETEKQSLKQKGRRLFTQVKIDKIKAQFQCRHLHQGRWLRVLQHQWNERSTTLSDSKDSKYRNCNSTNSLVHNRFLVWKIRFTTQVTTCSYFPSDALLLCMWIKEVEMVDSLDELTFLWSASGEDFSKLRDAGREDCLCSEQEHPEIPVQGEGQLGEKESPKRGPVSSRQTGRLHDLRLLSSDWRSWHSIGWCWLILCYSLWWQHSGIRYKIGRSSLVDVKNSIRWYLGKSVQIENTWVWSTQNRIRIEWPDWYSSEDIGYQQSKSWKTMVKRSLDQKLRLRNFDARHLKIESRAVIKSRKGLSGVEGGKGMCYQWKEKGQCSQRDRCSFRHET